MKHYKDGSNSCKTSLETAAKIISKCTLILQHTE
jgi:hypothetical protein